MYKLKEDEAYFMVAEDLWLHECYTDWYTGFTQGNNYDD